MAFLRTALHVLLMSAILAKATALKQYWSTRFVLVPILFFDGRQGTILHSRVKYSGPYEKGHSITTN